MDYLILTSLGGALNAYFIIALVLIVLGYMLTVVQRTWVFDPSESVVAREHHALARMREHNDMLLTLMAAQAGVDPAVLRANAYRPIPANAYRPIPQPTPGTRIDVAG